MISPDETASPDPQTMHDLPLSALLDDEARLSRRVVAARIGDANEALTAETYLELLAVRAAISQVLSWGSQIDVRDAIEAGATWTQIATARSTTTNEARADFRHWVDAQAALWDTGPSPAGAHFGLSPRQRQAVRALADHRD